jgi:hypothetical protein
MEFSILVEYATTLENNQLVKIGGTHADGTEWRLSAQRAISAIEEGRWNFHMINNGIRVDLVVVKVRGGFKELKAQTDKKDTTSLAFLPECPPVRFYEQAS